MTTLLAIAGAVVAFAAGWALGPTLDRTPSATTPVTPADSTPVRAVCTTCWTTTRPVWSSRTPPAPYRVPQCRRPISRRNPCRCADRRGDRAPSARRARPGSPVQRGARAVRTTEDRGRGRGQAAADGGRVAFVEDITEQRRADQVRTDFVANISHELKTPIGAMSVLAETLLDETDPATDSSRRDPDDGRGRARQSHRRRPDGALAHRGSVASETPRPVRVADIVSGAVERVTELAARRRRSSISTLDPVDADGLALGSDRRPRRPSRNSRRRSATSSRTPSSTALRVASVRYGSRRTDDAGRDRSVVDHGIGIPQRDLDRIFERFYRVDRARSRSTGGTGLGLSIVRHVATNHGGAVLVASTEGEGSTFVAAATGARAWTPARRSSPRTRRRTRGSRVTQPTILVVEDEASFVEALADRPRPRRFPRRGRDRRGRSDRAVRGRRSRSRACST